MTASDASDQASLGSNSAREPSQSWSRLIRSSRLRQRHQRRASQPTALCGGGPIRRSQAASTLVQGENGVFLDGSHGSGIARQEKGRDKDKRIRGKTTKRTHHSRNFAKLLRVVGSNEIGRHCKNYRNPL